MRFAVIGDVHSNIFALDGVLKDIAQKAVDFIVSTGDLVGYLPFPNEVIDRVRANRILVVQGNHDKAIAHSKALTDEEIKEVSMEEIQSSASKHFTSWIITKENRNYLLNLPQELKMSCGGHKIIIVHGSPRDVGEYLYEDEQKLTELSRELDEDVIICGHTHVPYHYEAEGKHFINAGSVGKPKHGEPQATYVIVTIGEGTVKSEITKVTYDVAKIVEAVRENPMIADTLIPMLEQGF